MTVARDEVDRADAAEISPAFDGELLAREAQAAWDAGETWRADALECARALLASRQGDEETALALWRSAFDRDPTLLVAFWGLRRALVRQGAWEELLNVLDRRIAAMSSAGAGAARADLWLDHGRILEDRLGRDDDAAHSYGFGLMEVADHPGLLTSLLLLGFRCGDTALTAAALSGLLRRSLPPALRVSIAGRLARLARAAGTNRPAVASGPGQGAAPRVLSPEAAGRALVTLQAALREVGSDGARPLLAELSLLARATPDAATRAEVLNELVARLLADPGASGTAGDSLAPPSTSTSTSMSASASPLSPSASPSFPPGTDVALMRERARLLRDRLGDPARAREALQAALTRDPGHPLVALELADLIEAEAAAGKGDAVAGLREVLTEITPGDWLYQTEAQRDLAFRYLTALVGAGRAAEGLALLDRHPELSRVEPDWFALEVILRMATGDTAGMAASFEKLGERLAAGSEADRVGEREGESDGEREHEDDGIAAAHAFVVAGTLRELGVPVTVSGGKAGRAAARETDPGRHYRRAADLVPGYEPALAAIERRLWAAGLWRELADLGEKRLERLRSSDARPGDDREREGQGQGGDGGGPDGVAGPEGRLSERARLLEDLVAVHRDLLDDPVRARVYQDELLASGAADTRAWARRHDLELAATLRGAPSSAEVRVRILRELADRAGQAEVEAALRIEAARVAAAAGDVETTEVLLREARPADTTGASTAGLERLAAAAAGAGIDGAIRAELVRSEISQLLEAPPDVEGKQSRLRALRFRVAWHAQGAKRFLEALEALQPLRADGDQLAHAWSWDIARRSGDPKLELAILRALPRDQPRDLLALPSDLGEALERAGDQAGAEAAFRDAQQRQPTTEAALGLLRIGSLQGNPGLVLDALHELAASADPATARVLLEDAAMLALLRGPAADRSTGPVSPLAVAPGGGDGEDAASVVLRWATGVRGGDALGAAAGLLAVARAVPESGSSDEATDRRGLLARAAARGRLGGAALGGAVHDQVNALSAEAAPIAVGLSDLPVAGRPERSAARVARAARSDKDLGYALALECGLDAEARGAAADALDGFAAALARDPEGLEALEGIKRLASATGDHPGAARVGMRLGMILRAPGRAAAELGMAGQIWEDLTMPREATIAYWQALRRDPESQWLYERLRYILSAERDGAGLDRLFGHRLAVVAEPRAKVGLLLERAGHRLKVLNDREAAIEDFKRILKIDPDHVVALRQLAILAVQMQHFPQAIRFLERLLARQTDPVQSAHLRLELAEAHEAARDPARAVEILRQAVSARPRDPAPWHRLTDLQLRMGDWSTALGTLRSWDAVLSDPIAKAATWLRIGKLLRDHGRDRTGAVAAFMTAADLDPLGDGVAELVALHEQAGAIGARQDAVRRAIDGLRQTLAGEPLDVPRLRRLKQLYETSARGSSVGGAASAADVKAVADAEEIAAAGSAVAAQILELAGEEVALSRLPREEFRGVTSLGFWNRLKMPGAGGFAEQIWPTLVGAATELFPPAPPRHPQRDRVLPGSEPRLAWVEAAAEAVGLPMLELFLPKAGTGDPADASGTPIEGPRPGMLLGPGVLAGGAAARFRVGRALGLLRHRAVVFDRMTDAEFATLLEAAGVVAGAPPRGDVAAGSGSGGGNDGATAVDTQARALGKALSRKDRKTLETEAARFGFEAIDARAFRQSILAAADRLGLVLAGDVAIAVRIAGGFDADPDTATTPASIAANPRALDLIRFALSEDYLLVGRGGAAAGGSP